MKLTIAERLYSTEPYRPDVYAVTSPRGVVTVIDRDENLLDILPRTALRYTITEAEELVEFLKQTWPDYEKDPYYRQGKAIYPIFQPPGKLQDVDIRKYTNALTVYRYKLASEYIYGITTRWTWDAIAYKRRAIEAPMDGWEEWLKDRKSMLQDKWIAEHEGNF